MRMVRRLCLLFPLFFFPGCGKLVSVVPEEVQGSCEGEAVAAFAVQLQRDLVSESCEETPMKALLVDSSGEEIELFIQEKVLSSEKGGLRRFFVFSGPAGDYTFKELLQEGTVFCPSLRIPFQRRFSLRDGQVLFLGRVKVARAEKDELFFVRVERNAWEEIRFLQRDYWAYQKCPISFRPFQ